MTHVLADMRARLMAAGITPVFMGRSPDTPDTLTLVRTYAGGPSRVFDGDNRPAVELLAVQVTTRAKRLEDALVLGRRAHDALVGRHLVINGVRYDGISANHLPAPVGVDDSDRVLVIVNFSVRRRGFQPLALA